MILLKGSYSAGTVSTSWSMMVGPLTNSQASNAMIDCENSDEDSLRAYFNSEHDPVVMVLGLPFHVLSSIHKISERGAVQ